MAKNMSFLPEDYLEKRIAQRTNVICLALFAVVMGGVIAAFLVTDQQRSEIRTLQEQVNGQFAEAARRLEQLEDLQKHKKQMIYKAKVTSALVERVPRSLILAEIINHMPTTLSLLEMDMETKALRTAPQPKTAMEREKLSSKSKPDKAGDEPAEVQIAPTELTVDMVGVAPTDVEVSDFMLALGNHPLFRDVNLQFSEEVKIDEQPMRKFRVELKVNQEADLGAIEPTLVSRELKQNPMGRTIQIDGNGELVAPTQKLIPVTDATPTRGGR